MSIAAGAKRLTVKVVTSAPIARLFRPMARGAVPIFTLHRFVDRETGSPERAARALRAQLAYLRKERFDVVALDALTGEPSGHRRSAAPKLAFTIDDGYADFAAVGAPIFAEFDCPVTVFLPTGVVDGLCWYWWDVVDYALEQTKRSSVHVETDAGPAKFIWNDRPARARAVDDLVALLKTLPERQKLNVLRRLPELLDVDVPPSPPPRFAPMSWVEINALGARGLVTFAPHSITHPVLSRTDDAQAQREIVGSWERLRAMCVAAVPFFCYPNGDYTDRDVLVIERSELRGAVSTENRYASVDSFASGAGRGRYAVPRVHYDEDLAYFIQIVSGFERLKLAVRYGRSGWRVGGAALGKLEMRTQ